jgi:hypothetical protein
MRIALALFMLGCGGVASGSDGGDAAADVSADSTVAKDAGGDAGWTDCRSPDGFQVCYGTHQCAPADCTFCQANFSNPKNMELTVCANDAWANSGAQSCWDACRDGELCVRSVPASTLFSCGGASLGKLFDINGGRDRVRYADWSLYDGMDLPLPATCPSLGLPLCGGACPPCAAKHLCTGRSPLHPYSMCVPENSKLMGGPEYCTKAKPACPNGMWCFVFKVQPSTQALADEGGYCTPSAQCQAAASNLPGGGFCY